MMFLTTHLDCCREDAEVLVHMLVSLLRRLHLSQEDRLDQEVVGEMVVRTRQREVLLLYLRYFNILMSRRKVKGEDGKVSRWYGNGIRVVGSFPCVML